MQRSSSSPYKKTRAATLDRRGKRHFAVVSDYSLNALMAERLEDRILLADQPIGTIEPRFGITTADEMSLPAPVVSGTSVIISAGVFAEQNGFGPLIDPTGSVTVGWYGGATLGTEAISLAYHVPDYLTSTDIAQFSVDLNLKDAGPAITTGAFAGDHVLYFTYSGDDNWPALTYEDSDYDGLLNGGSPSGNEIALAFKGDSLQLLTQPSNIKVGGKFSPVVQVAYVNTDGDVDASMNSVVYASLSTNSVGGGALGGNLSVNTVNGIATFPDLTIDQGGQYGLFFDDPNANYVFSNSFDVGPVESGLKFIAQPTTTEAGKTISPAVTVELLDSTGQVNTAASGSVTLSLQNASRLGVSTGTLSGTDSQSLVNGVATFNDLSVSANGTYTLQASDSLNDPSMTSSKFKVGSSGLNLEIVSKLKSLKGNASKGAASGDTILYSVLITSTKSIEGQVLVLTLPPSFVALTITGGGQPSGNLSTGNTITWTENVKSVSFDLTVPDAMTLGGLGGITKIVTTGDDNVTYSDGSTDEATASNSVKLATSYEVDGTVHDAIFRFPQIGTVVTSARLAGVIATLIDSTGAIIDTAVTNASGNFALTAKAAGTYKVQFTTTAGMYSTAANTISNLRVYIAKTVTFEPSNTTPINLGQLVLPKTFLDTAAKILNTLNNYKTSTFGGLDTYNVTLFQFNTTGAEGALSLLAGSAANPSGFMNPEALQVGAASDPWVAAIRMMTGLYEVNQRFVDAFKLVDISGKALSVILSVALVKSVTLQVRAFNAANPNQLNWKGLGIPMDASTQGLNNGERIALFGTLGEFINPIADTLLAKLNLPASDKAAFITAVFSTMRFGFDLLTGTKILDDGVFEAAFNLIRIAFDIVMLQTFAGVSIRPDVPGELTVLLSVPELTGAVLQGLPPNMQDVIDSCVDDRASYNTVTDTNSVLDSISFFDDQKHADFTKELFIVSAINNVGSSVRAIDGAGFQIGKASIAVSGNIAQQGYAYVQKAVQKVITTSSGAFNGVFKGGGKAFAAEIVIPAFVTAAFGFLEQLYTVQSVPNIVQNDTTASNAVITAPLPLAAAPAPAQSAQPALESAAVVHAAAASTSSDAAAFITDLTQISKFVKTGDTAGITALYPQFTTDEHSLFSNDLVMLDNQLFAVTSQLSTTMTKQTTVFDTDLHLAVNAVTFASEQLDTWGGSPTTGDASAVIAQINTAIQEVQAAVATAPVVRSIVSGLVIPAALVIDETSVPVSAASGSTQTFTVTVTNIGSQATSAGTITFDNSDGSLLLASAAQQDLSTLAPGASAIFTWQAQAVAPANPSLGAVYQISADAGDVTSSISDQISIT